MMPIRAGVFLKPAFFDFCRATMLMIRPIIAVKNDRIRPMMPSVLPGSSAGGAELLVALLGCQLGWLCW